MLNTYPFTRTLSLLFLLGMCVSLSSHAGANKNGVYWSGGVPGDRSLCPEGPLDTVSNPNAERETNVAEMTVEGVWRYIEQHNIQTIDELITAFPLHYKTNFSLVEHTRATGQSDIDRPRIVMFGSDGRFLLNIGTKEDDPKYNLLDVAELHAETGIWEFSMFDFSGDEPKLVKNDPDCLRCHGLNYARPIWGTNLDWPGVFGDNIAEGPNGEALDTAHLLKMREFKAGDTGSKRLDALVWSPQKMHRGGIRKVAHHIMGGELLLSNIAMGSANAEGVYTRLTQLKPEAYRQLRTDLVLAMIDRMANNTLPQNWYQRIDRMVSELDIPDEVKQLGTFDVLMYQLGVDSRDAFSLATMADTEAPLTNWQMGSGDLYEQVAMQVLWDLAQDDEALAAMLKTTPVGKPVFACNHVANNVWDIIQYKQLHLYQLRGEQRFNVNRVYFAADAEDIEEAVFKPLLHSLPKHLLPRYDVAQQ